jgi:hypothetical protein
MTLMQNSRSVPPAAHTPALTDWVTLSRFMAAGLISPHELTTPTWIGLMVSLPRPVPRMSWTRSTMA